MLENFIVPRPGAHNCHNSHYKTVATSTWANSVGVAVISSGYYDFATGQQSAVTR